MTDPNGAPPVQPAAPIPPPPASANDGVGAQSARVLGLALGGAAVALLGLGPIPAAAIIPAFGVLAVWAYGVWLKRKQNRSLMQLHGVLRDITGGWIQ